MLAESRNFIRHPSSIPIHFSPGQRRHPQHLKDVSHGGLCFCSPQAVDVGKSIHIEIDTCRPAFQAQGEVRWCKAEGQHYLVGVEFTDQNVNFALRMVEQICHIEAHRRQLEKERGISVSSEQAAFHWIKKFASNFPQMN